MNKVKSITKSKITQAGIAIVTIVAAAVAAIQAVPSMNVDGAACATFSACRALADAGSIWTISGDWSGSGKLSVPNNGIVIRSENNAVIQYASVSGNNVEMYGIEVKGGPVGVNGVYWSGDNGNLHNMYVHDAGLTGIRLYTAFGTIVQNNIVGDNRRGTAGNSDGINCANGGNNSFIGNESFNNGDDGFDMWNCADNSLRYNHAHDNCGGGDENGFKLGYGGGNLVEFNTASRNCSAGFAANEGGNIYKNNTADHNAIGFSDWRGASGGAQYSEYWYNSAWANGINYKINVPAQYVIFDKSNTTATPEPTGTVNLSTSTPTVTLTLTATRTANPPTATSTPTVTETDVPASETNTPVILFCNQPCKIIIEAQP